MGVALEVLGHIAHGKPRGLVAGDVARLILTPAGLVELLPTFHEAVGAAAWIDAQFGLKLEGADGAIDLAASRLVDELGVLDIGGFAPASAAWDRTRSN